MRLVMDIDMARVLLEAYKLLNVPYGSNVTWTECPLSIAART